MIRVAVIALGGRLVSIHYGEPGPLETLRVAMGVGVEAMIPAPVNVDSTEWRWDGAAWVHDPETPVPEPAPASVSALQLRRALRASGMTAAVDAYLATTDAATREDWEYATRIERLDPLVEGARIALQLTVAQRDDLFRLAATY